MRYRIRYRIFYDGIATLMQRMIKTFTNSFNFCSKKSSIYTCDSYAISHARSLCDDACDREFLKMFTGFRVHKLVCKFQNAASYSLPTKHPIILTHYFVRLVWYDKIIHNRAKCCWKFRCRYSGFQNFLIPAYMTCQKKKKYVNFYIYFIHHRFSYISYNHFHVTIHLYT